MYRRNVRKTLKREVSVLVTGRKAHSDKFSNRFFVNLYDVPSPLPVGVIQRLDVIRRKFLWQDHLVKWKEVILNRAQGGLGIKNLKNHSKALELKWFWRYSQDHQAYGARRLKLNMKQKTGRLNQLIQLMLLVLEIYQGIRACYDESIKSP